jgi:CMP-N,N'-diacetyllegionaminic acid synthase
MMAFVLGIIPARGGSKGIPLKNITPVAGKPLIGHTIEAALASKRLDSCILSTDSQAIADCAAEFGLRARDLRPAYLASDTASTIDTVIYEVEHFEKMTNQLVDVIVLLQPTAPMRTAADIDSALDLFFSSGAKSLISVYEGNNVHPNVMYFENYSRLTPVIAANNIPVRRQEFRPVYVRNGALYITAREQLFTDRSFIGNDPVAFVMPRERSANVDEPFDLEMTEWLMSRHA